MVKHGALAIAVFVVAGCYDPYAYPYNYYPQPYYQAGPAYAYAQGQQPDGQMITQAPPAPVEESIPAAPYDGAVWCDGYWGWSGATYVWIGGRYLMPPRVGFYWYPGGYVRRHGGYAFVHGRWAPPGWRHSHGFVHSGGAYYRGPVHRGWSWRSPGRAYRGGSGWHIAPQGSGHHGGHSGRGGHGGHHR